MDFIKQVIGAIAASIVVAAGIMLVGMIFTAIMASVAN